MELEYKYRAQNTLALGSVLSQVKKFHAFTCFLLKISYNIVLPSS